MVMDLKKLNDDAIVPTRGSKDAAGYDLYAYIPDGYTKIYPGCTVKIHTGVAVALPPCTFAGVYARSGLGIKQNLRPANCVGVIDSDYRGEIIVALFNDSGEMRTVANGDRIAQLVVQPYCPIDISVVDELDDTARGEGGFGSTGR